MPMRLESPSPIVCSECAGSKGREYEWCPVQNCRGSRSPEGCTHAQVGWEPCEACKGTGVETCSICDLEVAVMVARDGTVACQTCGLEQDGQLRLLDVA